MNKPISVRHAPELVGNMNGGELPPLDMSVPARYSEAAREKYAGNLTQHRGNFLMQREEQLLAATERAERFWEHITRTEKTEPKGLWEPDSAASSALPSPVASPLDSGLMGRMAEALRELVTQIDEDFDVTERDLQAGKDVLKEYDERSQSHV